MCVFHQVSLIHFKSVILPSFLCFLVFCEGVFRALSHTCKGVWYALILGVLKLHSSSIKNFCQNHKYVDFALFSFNVKKLKTSACPLTYYTFRYLLEFYGPWPCVV